MWIYQQEASDAAWKAYKLKLVNIIRTSSTMSFYWIPQSYPLDCSIIFLPKCAIWCAMV